MKLNNLTSAQVVSLITNKKVKVLANTSSHGHKVGSTLAVKSASIHAHNALRPSVVINGSWVYTDEIELVDATKKDLVDALANNQKAQSEALKSLKDAESNLKSRIEFLDAAGLDVFDENEYKVFNTLKALKSTKSDIEKAKVIAKLING